MSLPTPVRTLDARGIQISTHILFDVVEALESLQIGDALEVVTDDFTALDADIRSWASITGHPLIDAEPAGGAIRYLIRKAECAPTVHRMAVVISTDELTDLLSPLGFSLAAALEGLHVAVFFQGSGVRVLERGFVPRLRGWQRLFSGTARRRLEKAGHDHPQEKVRELLELGGTVYACGPSLQRFQVLEDMLAFDDVVIGEYVTFVNELDGADITMYC
ncbi:MAG: hypothetical protein HKN93_05010 [Acidimicrobiia bacterium]|nr:hypothetical protein [Acidimicrobiia bacterium]